VVCSQNFTLKDDLTRTIRWAKASWIASTKLANETSPWDMNTRYAAEDLLLSRASNLKRDNYCFLDIPHNLYDCFTPRSIYENLQLQDKPDGRCYTLPVHKLDSSGCVNETEDVFANSSIVAIKSY
jgi:hypothetical protein